MRRVVGAGVIVAGLLLPALSMGAGMPEPKVEYSAESHMETQGMVMTTKVYHAKQKDRMEMNRGSATNITITRRDKNVSWLLMPRQKTYMETALGEGKENGADMMNDCSIKQTPAGSETVNGIRTSKSKISMTCPNDLKYDGTMWVSKEGIMVKLDAQAKADERDVHVKMELTNLKVGKQDPGLFEVPAGYRKMAGFGDINAMMKDAQEKAARDAQEKAKRKQASKARNASATNDDSEDDARSFTSEPRSYTSKPKKAKRAKKAEKMEERARSYTADPRSYTANEKREAAAPAQPRSYTSESRSGSINPVNAIKGGIKNLLRW